MLAQSWWFSPGTPVSSTTKTGRCDIAEIVLKVALKHQNQSINLHFVFIYIGVQLGDLVNRKGVGVRDPIDWFNTTTFLCLSQSNTWISNVICRGIFFSVSLGER